MDHKKFYEDYKNITLSWYHVWGETEEDFWFHVACFKIVPTREGKELFSTHSSIHKPRYHPLLPFDKEGGISVYKEVLFDGYKPVGPWSNLSTDQVDIFVRHNMFYVYPVGTGEKIKYCINSKIEGIGDFLTEEGFRGFVKFKGWMDEYECSEPWGGLMASIKPHGELFPRKIIINNWDWVGLQLDNGLDIMAWQRSDGSAICTVIKNIGKDSHLVPKSLSTEDVVLAGDTLYISKVNLEIKLVELVKEQIYHPTVGMKYSEVPVLAMIRDKVIGKGMRERTYGGKKIEGGYHGT